MEIANIILLTKCLQLDMCNVNTMNVSRKDNGYWLRNNHPSCNIRLSSESGIRGIRAFIGRGPKIGSNEILMHFPLAYATQRRARLPFRPRNPYLFNGQRKRFHLSLRTLWNYAAQSRAEWHFSPLSLPSLKSQRFRLVSFAGQCTFILGMIELRLTQFWLFSFERFVNYEYHFL